MTGFREPSPHSEVFGAAALRLAGLAGWHLGWCPDQFWNATPAEMEAVVTAMLGGSAAEGGSMPPTPGEIARLKEMFPDG